MPTAEFNYEISTSILYSEQDYNDIRFLLTPAVDPFAFMRGYTHESYYTRPSIALGIIVSDISQAFDVKLDEKGEGKPYIKRSVPLYDVRMMASPHNHPSLDVASYGNQDNIFHDVPALTSRVIKSDDGQIPDIGVYMPYSHGTYVILAFPDDSFNNPIIIGALSNQLDISSQCRVHPTLVKPTLSAEPTEEELKLNSLYQETLTNYSLDCHRLGFYISSTLACGNPDKYFWNLSGKDEVRLRDVFPKFGELIANETGSVNRSVNTYNSYNYEYLNKEPVEVDEKVPYKWFDKYHKDDHLITYALYADRPAFFLRENFFGCFGIKKFVYDDDRINSSYSGNTARGCRTEYSSSTYTSQSFTCFGLILRNAVIKDKDSDEKAKYYDINKPYLKAGAPKDKEEVETLLKETGGASRSFVPNSYFVNYYAEELGFANKPGSRITDGSGEEPELDKMGRPIYKLSYIDNGIRKYGAEFITAQAKNHSGAQDLYKDIGLADIQKEKNTKSKNYNEEVLKKNDFASLKEFCELIKKKEEEGILPDGKKDVSRSPVIIKSYSCCEDAFFKKPGVKSHVGLSFSVRGYYEGLNEKSEPSIQTRSVNIYSKNMKFACANTFALVGNRVRLCTAQEGKFTVQDKNFSSLSFDNTVVLSGKDGTSDKAPIIFAPQEAEDKFFVDGKVCLPAKASSKYGIVYKEKSGPNSLVSKSYSSTLLVQIPSPAGGVQKLSAVPFAQSSETVALKYSQPDILNGANGGAMENASKNVMVKVGNENVPLMLIDSTRIKNKTLTNSVKFLYTDLISNKEVPARAGSSLPMEQPLQPTVKQDNFALKFITNTGSKTVFVNGESASLLGSKLQFASPPLEGTELAEIALTAGAPPQVPEDVQNLIANPGKLEADSQKKNPAEEDELVSGNAVKYDAFFFADKKNRRAMNAEDRRTGEDHYNRTEEARKKKEEEDEDGESMMIGGGADPDIPNYDPNSEGWGNHYEKNLEPMEKEQAKELKAAAGEDEDEEPNCLMDDSPVLIDEDNNEDEDEENKEENEGENKVENKVENKEQNKEENEDEEENDYNNFANVNKLDTGEAGDNGNTGNVGGNNDNTGNANDSRVENDNTGNADGNDDNTGNANDSRVENDNTENADDSRVENDNTENADDNDENFGDNVSEIPREDYGNSKFRRESTVGISRSYLEGLGIIGNGGDGYDHDD